MTIDGDNLHAALTPRIGKWQEDGQSKIIAASDGNIKPLPYSAYGETADNLFCTSQGLLRDKL